MIYERCRNCNRTLYGPEKEHPECKTCWLKKQSFKNADQVTIEEPKREVNPTFFDTNKKYALPGWAIALIFFLGVLIGAWLW